MEPDDPATGSALRIVPATADHLRALLAGDVAFQSTYQLRVVKGYIEFDGVLERLLDQVTVAGADPTWLTYLFIHIEDRALIGLGGFKGPPHERTVEIGYGIAPEYRGRGCATAAAGALIDRAQAAAVAVVIAHTLAEPNASTRVLARLGFQKTAIVEDAQFLGRRSATRFVEPGSTKFGDTWRWEKRLRP